MSTVVLLSGGIDSLVCAELMRQRGDLTGCVFVDYGHPAQLPEGWKLLSLAANAAIGMGATRLCIGANQADHEDYPDCRPGFFATMGRALGIEILTPLINMSKRAIIIAATDRGLTREDAWSCYLGGPRACGSCPSCLEADQAWVTA